MSCTNGSPPPEKDLASDQIAFDAFKNDFGKSSKTVFQNGYPGADLGKSLNKKISRIFCDIGAKRNCSIPSCAAYECAQGMKMGTKPVGFIGRP
jgi:hypothetical protein